MSVQNLEGPAASMDECCDRRYVDTVNLLRSQGVLPSFEAPQTVNKAPEIKEQIAAMAGEAALTGDVEVYSALHPEFSAA